MECTFEELREDIVIAIQKIPSEGEFVDRLNQLIRDYVEVHQISHSGYLRLSARGEESIRDRPRAQG
jgi:hypothetical protein